MGRCGIAGEEWRIKPNYKIKPKMFWRLNKIASDKRKLLECGEKTGFWLKRTFFASVSYGFILSSLKSIRRILLTSF